MIARDEWVGADHPRRSSSAGLLILLLAGCAGQRETVPPPPVPDVKPSAAPAAEMVTVQVQKENLRSSPNGAKVGEVGIGTSLVEEERRGNWVNVTHPEYGPVWIWGPSVGFAQVNPLSVPLWLGGSTPRHVAALTATFGKPLNVQALGGNVYLYSYPNHPGRGAGTLFGTDEFHEIDVWVDGLSRQALRVEFALPPFEGTAPDLLRAADLPQTRSTTTDFNHAVYLGKFPGITRLEMMFSRGSFNRIEFLAAERFPEDAFESALVVGEKKIIHDGHDLLLSLTVRNKSGEYAFAAPVVKLQLMEGGEPVGEWILGPIEARIEPGETELIRELLPVGDEEVDVNRVEASAAIISAIPVPPSPASQP